MARVIRGATFAWSVIVRDGTGALADPSNLDLIVVDPAGRPIAGSPVPFSAMTKDSTGLYHWIWDVPSNAATGTYAATWTGTLSGQALDPARDAVDVVVSGSMETPASVEYSRSYLTAERLRTSGLKLNLTGWSDFELDAMIELASADVDSYCNVPLLPEPHSFLGGTAYNEEHSWAFPSSPFDPGRRRVYPKHWPIRDILEFKIKVGYGSDASIPVTSLVVNNAERWVELTALTIANNSGLFGVAGWVVPIGGLQVPVSLLSYTYGDRFTVKGERLRPIDASNLIYQTRQGFWSSDRPSVSVGGAVQTSGYTLDYENGRVTFDAIPEGQVRADYVTLLAREIERATGLIAAWYITEEGLRRKGMAGLERLKIAEVEASRPRMRTQDQSDLAERVPAAAALLGGFRFWSIGGA